MDSLRKEKPSCLSQSVSCTRWMCEPSAAGSALPCSPPCCLLFQWKHVQEAPPSLTPCHCGCTSGLPGLPLLQPAPTPKPSLASDGDFSFTLSCSPRTRRTDSDLTPCSQRRLGTSHLYRVFKCLKYFVRATYAEVEPTYNKGTGRVKQRDSLLIIVGVGSDWMPPLD